MDSSSGRCLLEEEWGEKDESGNENWQSKKHVDPMGWKENVFRTLVADRWTGIKIFSGRLLLGKNDQKKDIKPTCCRKDSLHAHFGMNGAE